MNSALLRRLHIDALHLDEKQVEALGWVAIHAENDGQLELEEMELLAGYCKENQATTFYASSWKEICKGDICGNYRAVQISQISTEYLAALQGGINFVKQPNKKEDADLSASKTFYASTSFNKPMNFVLLREAEGYGWTTLAGEPNLIEMFKSRPQHKLYLWRDGVLPIWIAGSSDPGRKY